MSDSGKSDAEKMTGKPASNDDGNQDQDMGYGPWHSTGINESDLSLHLSDDTSFLNQSVGQTNTSNNSNNKSKDQSLGQKSTSNNSNNNSTSNSANSQADMSANIMFG